jgi:hypothetical protein
LSSLLLDQKQPEGEQDEDDNGSDLIPELLLPEKIPEQMDDEKQDDQPVDNIHSRSPLIPTTKKLLFPSNLSVISYSFI